MFVQFTNSGDHDQTPRSVASDLGLHCLLITVLGISRLESAKLKRLIAFRIFWFIFAR